MENRPNGNANESTPTRRRRRSAEESNTQRFFLPKPGSSMKSPELGQEFTTEGAVLVEALKKDQWFYSVTIWRAVAEQNGGNPVITRKSVTETRTE